MFKKWRCLYMNAVENKTEVDTVRNVSTPWDFSEKKNYVNKLVEDYYYSIISVYSEEKKEKHFNKTLDKLTSELYDILIIHGYICVWCHSTRNKATAEKIYDILSYETDLFSLIKKCFIKFDPNKKTTFLKILKKYFDNAYIDAQRIELRSEGGDITKKSAKTEQNDDNETKSKKKGYNIPISIEEPTNGKDSESTIKDTIEDLHNNPGKYDEMRSLLLMLSDIVENSKHQSRSNAKWRIGYFYTETVTMSVDISSTPECYEPIEDKIMRHFELPFAEFYLMGNNAPLNTVKGILSAELKPLQEFKKDEKNPEEKCGYDLQSVVYEKFFQVSPARVSDIKSKYDNLIKILKSRYL